MSENPDALLREARRLQQEGQLDKARELVVNVLQVDRANPDAWQMAAMLTDDEREKCEALRRALGLDPNNTQLRELYNSLGCGEKITRSTTTAARVEAAQTSSATSTMMMVLLIVMLVVVAVGAGGAFLATSGSDDEPPTEEEVEGAVIVWLENLGPSAAINPASLASVTVEQAQFCEPTDADKDEGITSKWLVDVDYEVLEGANLALSGGEIPYTWTVFGRDGDWFIDIRTGTCIFQ